MGVRWKEIDEELKNVTGIGEGDKKEQMEKGREGKKMMGGVGKQKREE